jgi:hypothetical protein
MFIRVVALLLAIIVLWTGLNTIELRDPAVLSPPQFSVSVFHPGGPPSKPQGSVAGGRRRMNDPASRRPAAEAA